MQHSFTYSEYESARKTSSAQDVNRVLEVDQRVMNFYNCLPGKMLGSNLLVTNKTNCDQIIEISIDQETYFYNKQSLLERFPDAAKDSSEDLKKQMIPFSIRKKVGETAYKQNVPNSEIKYKCWSVENPVSKDLTKRITLKLGPRASQEFILVLNSPLYNNNLLTIVDVSLLNYKHEKFGLLESFETFLKNNY